MSKSSPLLLGLAILGILTLPSIAWSFETVPDSLPERWFDDQGLPINWGVGHLGHGVFLTRNNNGGPNDVPGVSYSAGSTQVHLFQAADGDTNADRNLNGDDIQRILSENLFASGLPADWSQGDFNADGVCNGDDIQAILSTGLWPTDNYAAVPPGEPLDGVVDLVVDPADGMVLIDTDGMVISGYVIKSTAGVFTGEPANNLGWFVEDTDWRISGNMGIELEGVHPLGAVIGSEWEILTKDGPVDLYDDLTFTYTVFGSPGTLRGSLIVIPEPGTLVLLLTGLLGLLLLATRRRRTA